MATCGECKHWERAKGYQWGECCYPLPMLVGDEDTATGPLFPGESADRCECFAPAVQPDDACEWREDSRGNFTPSCQTNYWHYRALAFGWRYCPYCGKKIKEVRHDG